MVNMKEVVENERQKMKKVKNYRCYSSANIKPLSKKEIKAMLLANDPDLNGR